ncbi:AEC family transporter [Marinobacterium sp. D7]|uniref:AEC family transporter n=1 Tax=Marinobacterium ramblicola TaxID=2849041 RepID=UPI001C2DC8EB|nr:AEC family transporter [Marinobacterium ramblicola]MBV1787039.1 AEC family transporter [Marinobacterium ramblicola]
MDVTSLQLIERIFQTVVPLVAIVGLGYIYARRSHVDMSVANRINMDLFCPALIFSVMSAKSFDLVTHIDLAIGALLVVLGSGLLVWPLCRLIGVAPKTFVPPMMFNNSGNLGIPLVVLAFGEYALPAAVVMFLVENLLHFTVGMYIMDHRTHPMTLARNPMILATVAGLIWSLFKLPLPMVVHTPIDMLGKIAIPLMLFALGVRMTSIDFSNWKPGLWGSFLAPLSGLLIAIPVTFALGLDQQQTAYLILFGALPPAVLNYMVSERYNQEPQQVASIVLISNMASLAIIPLTLAFIL